jgi:hypothetical protein
MGVRLQAIIKVLFTILLLFIFLAGGIFIIFTFGKSSYDTTSITNAGFAIFAGCASVSFAWARTQTDMKDIAKIKRHGENLFLSALCFVIASLSKYIFIHRTELISDYVLDYVSFIFPVINFLGATMFFLAYVNAWAAVLGLLRILFRKSLTRV